MSGPSQSREVYPFGTAKLSHADGSNFKVNCHRLKHYGGDTPPLDSPNKFNEASRVRLICPVLTQASHPLCEIRVGNNNKYAIVSVTIQQDISVFPPMTSPVIGPVPRPGSPNVHGPLPTTTTTTVATTTTTLPLPPQPQQGPSDPILIKRMGELEEFIANLVEEN
ncbi:hypothetical protein Tco_0748441 [Tanacetum coccineum]|uniref:Uncharacterized protein n=1 Tax=Tanacetum coccineum TaxID=301880 RepID=A0ABQ4YVV9_9ASTR